MHGAGSNFIGIKERQLAVEVVSYMYQKLGDPLRVIERERERYNYIFWKGHITEHFLFFDFWM